MSIEQEFQRVAFVEAVKHLSDNQKNEVLIELYDCVIALQNAAKQGLAIRMEIRSGEKK